MYQWKTAHFKSKGQVSEGKGYNCLKTTKKLETLHNIIVWNWTMDIRIPAFSLACWTQAIGSYTCCTQYGQRTIHVSNKASWKHFCTSEKKRPTKAILDWNELIMGPLHMSPVNRAGSVTEIKLMSVHMVTFSPLSEMKNLKKWWRDYSGVKSNEQAWREFLDFLCWNNHKFLLTLR